MPEIKINSVTMSYAKEKSLDSINAVIDEGSIFGLIGSNGSGKSTLLRTMCGIIKPASGEVLVGGEPVFENENVRQKIVYLPDEQYFLPHCSINDMKDTLRAVRTSFSDKTFAKMRDIFKLDCDKKVASFSKGMKKQASVMLGIASTPSCLLCDETFDGLDPVVRQLVKRILADESAERGMTTVIASHNLREIEDICDTVGLLHKGQLLFVKGLDDMKLGLHKIQAVFSGDFDVARLSPLKISGYERRGSLVSFIAHGEADEINAFVAALSPAFYEMVPMSLEEIFITEMEEKGYEFGKLVY